MNRQFLTSSFVTVVVLMLVVLAIWSLGGESGEYMGDLYATFGIGRRESEAPSCNHSTGW